MSQHSGTRGNMEFHIIPHILNNVKLHVTPCSRMFTHFPQSYQNSLVILLSVMVLWSGVYFVVVKLVNSCCSRGDQDSRVHQDFPAVGTNQ